MFRSPSQVLPHTIWSVVRSIFLNICGEGVKRFWAMGRSVIVGMVVGKSVGVRVGGTTVIFGSCVDGTCVGPAVFTANKSRVAVGVGNCVTVGTGVLLGPTVGVGPVFKNGRFTGGNAEQPATMAAITMMNIFFIRSSSNNFMEYCINCIPFDGNPFVTETF